MYSPERRRRVHLYFRDWLLILILVFMAALVGSKWSEYAECADPMAAWLVVNFLSLLALRIQQFAAQWCISGRSPLARAEDDASCVGGTLPKALLFVNCYLLFPFIVCWSVLGCLWYNRSHDCLPQSMSGWSFIAWIILALIMQLLHGGLLVAVAKRRAWYPQSIEVEPGSCQAWMQAFCALHLLMLDHLQRLEAHALGLENDARAAAANGGARGAPLNAVFLLRQPVVVVGPGQARPGAVSTGLNPEQIAALAVRPLEPVERRDQLCSICLVEFPMLPPHLDPTASAATAASSSSAAANGAAHDEPQAIWPPGSTGADDDAAGAAASASPVASDPLAGPAALQRVPSPAAGAAEVSTVRHPSRTYSTAPLTVFALPCRHVFHTECLASWLKEEGRCPNCRQRIGPPLEEIQAAAQARLEAEQRAQIAAIQAQLQAMHDAHLAAAAAQPPAAAPRQQNSPEALMRLSHYQQSQMFDPSASSSSSSAAAIARGPPPQMRMGMGSPQQQQQLAPGLPSPEAPLRFTIVNMHRDPSAASGSGR